MYQRILVPIDGSSTAERALQEAIKLADGKAQIHLVYVVEEILMIGAEGLDYANNAVLQESAKKAAAVTLATAADKISKSVAKVDTVLLEALGNGVADAINNEAQNWLADLIVIGTHGRTGLTRLLLGSVAEGVIRKAAVPVLLIRA